jgi:two-component system sensor histidine kinase/response regulator
MDDYLTKPVEVTALVETLVRWTRPLTAMEEAAPDEIAAVKIPVARATVADSPSPGARRIEPVASLGAPRAATLSEIAGLDYQGALERLAGNAALFRKLLGRFVEGHASSARHISAHLEAGDFDAARREAHGVKGVAANLGLQTVSEAASALEQTLRQGSRDTLREAAFERALDGAVGALRSALGE